MKTREEKLAQKKEYYARNREMMQKRARDWRATHPERRREMNRKWNENNPEAYKELYQRQVEKNKKDPNYKAYLEIHYWVRKNLGKPSICTNCLKRDAKRYEWANISREYKRDLLDWVRLCKSCHTNYDLGKIKLRNTL